MLTAPKRRWFRFSLRTLLILTALAAWTMSYRPYAAVDTEMANGYFSVGDTSRPGWIVGGGFMSDGSQRGTASVLVFFVGPRPQLYYPFGAFMAFIGWMVFNKRRIARRAILVPSTE